jgi:hypothetical protein
VLARKPSSSAGRYCIRLSLVFTRAVSSARLRLARLARDERPQIPPRRRQVRERPAVRQTPRRCRQKVSDVREHPVSAALATTRVARPRRRRKLCSEQIPDRAGDGSAGPHHLAVADPPLRGGVPVLDRPVPPRQPRDTDSRQISQASPVVRVEAQLPYHFPSECTLVSNHLAGPPGRAALRVSPGLTAVHGFESRWRHQPARKFESFWGTNPCKVIRSAGSSGSHQPRRACKPSP